MEGDKCAIFGRTKTCMWEVMDRIYLNKGYVTDGDG